MPIDQWFRDRGLAAALGLPRPDYLTLARWRKFAECVEKQLKELVADEGEIISTKTGEIMFSLTEALRQDLARDWAAPRAAWPTTAPARSEPSEPWSATETSRALIVLAGRGDLHAVKELSDLAELFREATTEAGQRAVRVGRNCAAIGRALGMSRANAWLRFSERKQSVVRA